MFKRINNFLAALDIGSTKICATIGEVSESGNLRVKGVGTSLSCGIKKTGIENPVEITAAIKRAMLRAERMSGLVAEQCLLSFSGAFIRSEIGEGEMEIAGDLTVGESDVAQLLEHIGSQLRHPGEKVIHIIPLLFKLDGNESFSSPVGKSGRVLKARILLAAVSEEIYNQFAKACSRAGLKIMETVVPALANYRLVPEKYKNKNLILTDWGGKFTEVSFFKGRVLQGLAVIPFGAAHLTNDLAYGLNVSVQEAERLKILFGRIETGETPSEEEFLELNTAEESGPPAKISKKFINEIITARVNEIFKKIKAEVDRMIGSEGAEEMILTGGGSLLKGIEIPAGRILNLPVVREKIVFNNELVGSPVYNVSVGLVLYGMKKGLLKPVAVPRNFLYQMAGETKRWFQEFF